MSNTKIKKIIYYIRFIYNNIFGYGLEKHFTEHCEKAYKEYLSNSGLEMLIIEPKVIILYNRNIHISCYLAYGLEFHVRTQIRQNENYDLEHTLDGIYITKVVSFIDEQQNELKTFKPCLTNRDLKEDIYQQFSLINKYCQDFINGDLGKWEQLKEYDKIYSAKFRGILKNIDELIAIENANRELIYDELLKLFDYGFYETGSQIRRLEYKTNHLTNKEKDLMALAKDYDRFRWMQ